MFELIQELTELPGPVGQEGAVLERIEALWQEAGVTVTRTRLGNRIGRVGGEGPRVLLVAHADELCYLVRAIHPDGFLWLANGQAWQRTTSLRNAFTIGQRVQVLAPDGPIPGVIATVTGHLASLALPELNELSWKDFWVDTGLSRDELLARGVTPGTRVIWDGPTVRLGRDLVMGKALDDRALLAVLTEVLRRVPTAELGCQLTVAATVQEEIGLVGASALAAREAFDAAVILEVGLAGDVPGIGLETMPVRLGGGPILVHKDSLVHYDHRLTTALARTAAAADIPLQHAVFGSFGSDGAAFMKADVPAGLVAFPTRYTHTPFETAHLGDIEALTAWMCAFVRRAREVLA
ncbi:M20/M25/M40 family metallo-hydrolase [Litorilinea aerophila]|uniref:M20/M25/M40 family metallo-hydrolase n=1 Tax=Litorilinea aerophila TaxID=1204385 RepID=A0A540VMV1_9CHLR|nr:M20/M25/M40 family metallo-hydrolase [Litorilinea aerophila]MCC9075143.1 M20/M25/M40 family metallo-hydrolase [Litorilinea aerophila]